MKIANTESFLCLVSLEITVKPSCGLSTAAFIIYTAATIIKPKTVIVLPIVPICLKKTRRFYNVDCELIVGRSILYPSPFMGFIYVKYCFLIHYPLTSRLKVLYDKLIDMDASFEYSFENG